MGITSANLSISADIFKLRTTLLFVRIDELIFDFRAIYGIHDLGHVAIVTSSS